MDSPSFGTRGGTRSPGSPAMVSAPSPPTLEATGTPTPPPRPELIPSSISWETSSLLLRLWVRIRLDKVKALVNLSVPLFPRNPNTSITSFLRSLYGDDHYVCRFQEPGDIEEEFARLGADTVLRKVFAIRDPGPLLIPKGWGSPNDQISLPSWLSEDDINYFVSKYKKTGFTGPVNYYRNFDLNWELTAPWHGVQIKVPAKFIVGDQDLVYHYFPGIQEYIHDGGFKKDVPLLEEVIVMPGVCHWINQEKPREVTDHIYDFIRRF